MNDSRRVISYVRQSVGKAGEHADDSLSLEAQDDAIRRYCAEQGWTIAKSVRDHDVSGKSWTRPGIAELLAAAESGDVDTVVVYKLSRFSRDALYQEITHRELKERGVGLVSVTEGGAEKTLIRLVYGAVNQHHNEELSQWVSDTIRQNATRGRQHGQPPFGYETAFEGKRRVQRIVEADAATVRRVFDLRASGMGIAAIVNRLHEDRVPTPAGAMWHVSTIRRMLANPRYAGYSVYRGEIVGDSEPGHMPAIIDRAAWHAAQALFQGERSPRQKAVSSWLEGLVHHGCGAKMYLRSLGRKSPVHFLCQHSKTGLRTERCAVRPGSIVPEPFERAARLCLITDLAMPRADAQTIVAEHLRVLGQDAAVERRTLLESKRAGVVKAMRRAEDLVLSELRDHAWLREKNAEQMAELKAIDVELSTFTDLPRTVDIEPLLRQLDEASAFIEHANEDDLRRTISALGRVIFDASGVHISYNGLGAAIIPRPTVIKPRWNASARKHDFDVGP